MRRSIGVFFCLIFSLALLIGRLFLLSVGQDVRLNAPGSTRTVQAVRSRGMIYDRQMRPFVSEQSRIVAAAAPLPQTADALRRAVSAQDLQTALRAFSTGLPAAVPVTCAVRGQGIHLFRQPIRYGETFLIPHIAGYCGADGCGVCGVEKSFEPLLAEKAAGVTYPLDGLGRVLPGGDARVWDEGVQSPRGVVLTLDKAMQSTVRRALLKSGMRKGAAVLLDVHTGDILALVSLPEFDVRNPQESLDDPDAPFLNRALNAVSVGSVYKMIVTAAALEQGVSPAFAYTCTGQTQQDDVTFHCHLRSGHGMLTLANALYHSCNTYFIHLAQQIPVQSLLDLSWRLGLGTPVTLADDLVAESGILPDPSELTTDAARANIAFGQGRLTASPLQIAAATAAIAAGGIYHEPRLIAGTVDLQGNSLPQLAAAPKRVLRESTALQVREMLVYAAAQTENLSFKNCGGKTATAQTGVYKNGDEMLNTWYSGFFPADTPQYALTVLWEEGTSGAKDCIPVFQHIALELTESRASE